MNNFKKVEYIALGNKIQEVYNMAHTAHILAQYGYECITISNDSYGPDFLAIHYGDFNVLKIQLKGRPTLAYKYYGKDIIIAWIQEGQLWMINHDEIVDCDEFDGAGTSTYLANGYHWRNDGIPKWLLKKITKLTLEI